MLGEEVVGPALTSRPTGEKRRDHRAATAEVEAPAVDHDGELPGALRAAAWALWEERYEGLNADRPGLLGASLRRAEAQVVRLALVYALPAWQATCSRTAPGHRLAAVTGSNGAGPRWNGNRRQADQMNSKVGRDARPAFASNERMSMPPAELAAAWLVKRHRDRPNLAALVAHHAGLGERSAHA